MVKVICFDLDGVYFLKGKENFIANLVKLGVSEEKAKEVFFQSDKMNKEYKAGLIGDREFWSWAIREWKLSMGPKEVINLMISGYEINQPAVELVRKLKSNGYKTAVCSNNFPARINGLNERFDFLKDFDVIVLSYKVGVLKPDRGIFEELIKKSNVKPEEIVYSDDSKDKLSGAESLGIKTFVYHNFSRFCRELKRLGVRI